MHFRTTNQGVGRSNRSGRAKYTRASRRWPFSFHGAAKSYASCVHTQIAYNSAVKAVFVELPAFARFRADYLDDAAFGMLQQALMKNPDAGDVIEGTGGLRKMRCADARRGKGKRGGLRVIYCWWIAGMQFWLYTLYDKDEMSDLTPKERKVFKEFLKAELESRRVE